MQEQTPKTITTGGILPGGKVKPFEKVQVEWIENKKLGTKALQLEYMHPVAAEKLLKKKLVKKPTPEALKVVADAEKALKESAKTEA